MVVTFFFEWLKKKLREIAPQNPRTSTFLPKCSSQMFIANFFRRGYVSRMNHFFAEFHPGKDENFQKAMAEAMQQVPNEACRQVSSSVNELFGFGGLATPILKFLFQKQILCMFRIFRQPVKGLQGCEILKSSSFRRRCFFFFFATWKV